VQVKRSIRRAWIAALPALVGAALAPSSAFAASADVSIAKEASAGTVTEGDVFRYVVTVGNAGPDQATKVVMVDRIANRLELIGAETAQGSCRTEAQRRVRCNLGTLNPGSSERVRIRVRARVSGEVTNTARALSAVPDPDRMNNSASATTNVLAAGPPATCAGQKATIVGTEGDDTLIGTDKRDVIVGLSGNDTIEGLRVGDIICGNGGADSIKSQGGNDVVRGGGGNDEIRSGGGNDDARGGTDGDAITSGTGNDGLRGIGGDDVLRGRGGDDVLRGGGGNDELRGGGGANACIGGGGNNIKRHCD
jgi:uncharacterized repeat protein (TIGR01451 family)